ncbi:MAG: signal peptidase I [Clostridia bacterium]|nr:signal peptidase I [Clostridia bacterium]
MSNNDELKKTTIKNTIILIEKIIFLSIVIFVVTKYFFEVTRINTNGMQPYVYDGDLALVYKKKGNYTIGDVIMFKKDNKKYVLRIIAKEGQVISMSESGNLIIDGWPENRETVYKTYPAENSNITYPYVVEPGKVFVMNDNRYEDDDSRYFGAIETKSIVGKVVSVVRTRNI